MTIFLIILSLFAVTGAIYLFRPIDYNAGLAPVTDADEFNAKVTELQREEDALRRVRRRKRRMGWKRNGKWIDEIDPYLQFQSIRATDDAFETILIEKVWGKAGKEFEEYRRKQSYLRERFVPKFSKNYTKSLNYA